MFTKINKKRDEGFTIIEVMIVLAIAALILVIVFLAVPALQRTSRNTSRKNDAANSLSALSNFVSNNGGSLPASSCIGSGTASGQCTFLTDVKFGYYNATGSTTIGTTTTPNVQYCATFAGSPCATAPTTEQMWLAGDATCSSATTATANGATVRQFVAWYGIEGSIAHQCVEG